MNWLATFLLDYVLKKLSTFFMALYRKLARRKAIQNEAKESVQPLKDAKTAEEIDRATDQALDRF